MPTINPVDPNNAGDAAQTLATVKAQMGRVPNIFATMANSASVLDGFLGFSAALRGGVIGPAVGEQIALTVAGQNSCDYCASAHSAIAAGAGIDSQEAAENLRGRSGDAKTDAMLVFAAAVVEQRGQVSEEQITTLREAGVSDAEFVELIAHVALNTFTNYFNHIAGTEIDFPFVNSSATTKAA